MLTQPDFTTNPADLIKSDSNKRFLETLLSRGMRPEKITEILIRFFSYKVVLRDLFNHVNNPEWVEERKWHKTVEKQYNAAIKKMEALLIDQSIPLKKRETIIKKDVEQLKQRRDFLTFAAIRTPSLSPNPASYKQMLHIQARALYEYMNDFDKHGRDGDIYDLIAELFINLYSDTAFNAHLKGLTGKKLKSNFVDNAYKLTSGKNKELEEKIKGLKKKQ